MADEISIQEDWKTLTEEITIQDDGSKARWNLGPRWLEKTETKFTYKMIGENWQLKFRTMLIGNKRQKKARSKMVKTDTMLSSLYWLFSFYCQNKSFKVEFFSNLMPIQSARFQLVSPISVIFWHHSQQKWKLGKEISRSHYNYHASYKLALNLWAIIKCWVWLLYLYSINSQSEHCIKYFKSSDWMILV